jgi:hypothetical protein
MSDSLTDARTYEDPRVVLTDAEIAACLEEGADPVVVARLVAGMLSGSEGPAA